MQQDYFVGKLNCTFQMNTTRLADLKINKQYVATDFEIIKSPFSGLTCVLDNKFKIILPERIWKQITEDDVEKQTPVGFIYKGLKPLNGGRNMHDVEFFMLK